MSPGLRYYKQEKCTEGTDAIRTHHTVLVWQTHIFDGLCERHSQRLDTLARFP